jgi:Mn2+/Fe2+ NRAMP family transporter
MKRSTEIAAKIKGFWRILGPGLVTGAADDDPSGIATYSQTGAQFGYGQLWTALYMLPLISAGSLRPHRPGNR